MVGPGSHYDAVEARVEDFCKFARDNPDRMKQPTTPPALEATQPFAEQPPVPMPEPEPKKIMATKKKMTRKAGPITLGESYIDTVHDRTGIAETYAIHLTGCNRVGLSYRDNDGNVKEFWVDETRLTDIDGEPVIPAGEEKPGPGMDPPSREM